MHRTLLLLLWLPALGSFFGAAAQSRTSSDGYKLVDKTGNIRKPDDYREAYQMIGAYTILDPKGNQMHDTYASPGAAEYYRRNKKFADGTVLVKEVHGTDHAAMTALWQLRPMSDDQDDAGDRECRDPDVIEIDPSAAKE